MVRCPADVVVVGSCNYDQIVYVPHFPGAGATIYGTAYATGFGGKGANQVVMAAKMGAKTAIVGALGSDQIARMTRENFSKVGVDTRDLYEKEGASGVAQICVSAKDGDNNIVIVPGANLLLSDKDLAAARDIICKSKVLLLQNEVPASTTLAAMQMAKSAAPAPLVILNAAPPPTIGDRWQEGQWQQHQVQEMLSCCDILCVNESEAQVLSGVHVAEADDEQELLNSVLAAAAKLQQLGAKKVLITLGGRGSCLVRQDGSHWRVKGPQEHVEVVDTSGAGDAYLGALAAYLAASKTLEEALELAGKVATISVTSKGTQASFPSLKSLPPDLWPSEHAQDSNAHWAGGGGFGTGPA